MLRRLDDCDLVPQVHGLRALRRLPLPGPQLRRGQLRDIARVRAGGTVNCDCGSAREKLRIRPKAGSRKNRRIARIDRFGAIDPLRRRRPHEPIRRYFEPAPIHFVHPRIHAHQDSRAGGRELLRNGCEVRDADGQELRTVGKPLYGDRKSVV